MELEPIGEIIDNGTESNATVAEPSGNGDETGSRNREPEREIIEGIPTIDPITLGEWTDEPTVTISSDATRSTAEPVNINTGRKRGRPPGTRNRPKESTGENLDLKSLIYSAHLALAAIIDTPELEIDESEAKKLQDAILRMQKVYPTLGLSEKQMAWGNLICAASGVYVPRVVAIYKRGQMQPQELKQAKQPTPIRQPVESAPLTNPSQLNADGGGVEGTIHLGF